MSDGAPGRPSLSHLTVVVTGAAGFLGSALVDRLTASGARVVGVDVAGRSGDGSAEWMSLDLLRAEAVREGFLHIVAGDANSAVVIHMAGRGHVGACREDPAAAVATNVIATTNVLEACRKAGIRRVVFPSSALVYRTPSLSRLSEESPVAARSIYAATKLASELLLEAYAIEYGLSGTVARLGNVYGRGAAADSVASIVIRQVLSGDPVVLDSLAPVRDFVYRDDVVSGLIALATQPGGTGFQLFNLSSGVPTSIGELAETASVLAGVQEKPTERTLSSGSGSDSVVLSIERMTAATGWKPAFSIDAGLRATLAESRG